METFKVLITGCEKEVYWYKNKIGNIIEVKNDDEANYVAIEQGRYISKSDCHVIEPVWKVMKDAEETGRAAEKWNKETKAWTLKGYLEGWRPMLIYRLAPEPKQPEYEPYSYGDREKLRGLWVRRKNDGAEFMIMAVYSWGVGTNETCPEYQCLFDEYETLDGQPVGKLK